MTKRLEICFEFATKLFITIDHSQDEEECSVSNCELLISFTVSVTYIVAPLFLYLLFY